MKIENPYYSTSSLPTYTHIYWQDDEIHVSLLSLLLKKKMKTTGHHFATNTSPTLLSTHTKSPQDRQTDSQRRLLLQTLQRKIGCFWRPQPASSLPLYPYLGRYRGNTRNFTQTVLQAAHDLEKRKKKRQMQPNQAADDSPDLTTPNQQQGNRKKKKEKRKANMGKGCPHSQQACRVCTFPTSLRVHVGRKRPSFGGKGMNE